MRKYEGVISFLDYRVTSVTFQLNQNYDTDEEMSDVNIEAKSDFIISDEKTNMIVTLELQIFGDEEGNYPFKMNVELDGLFELSGEIKNEDIRKYYANALSILYPYARAIVSNYTANANVQPLILPTVNIWKMINSQKNKEI
ncbi:MAG: protein-export chaperone SecB [Lachnospiraceae bacterium]|nr:protein-export chaperone SecB [Lachnospiraceae bacterium]